MNKLVILFFSYCALATAQIPTNGLVSSYPFSGNSNDASGNGNHLTPFNGPTLTTDRFGNPNSAYFFDGINDYFTAPNPGPLLKRSRSLAFWAKMSANPNSSGYAVLNYGDPYGSGARFEIGLNANCKGIYADLGNGYAVASYSNTSDNIWHFYTVVFDSSTSTQLSSIKFYVDAVLTSSYCVNPWVQTVNTVNNLPINIGRFHSGFPRYFSGSLDDIHVYNRPLTQIEISNMFNPCTAGPSNPGQISGISIVCSGISQQYSISPVSGATTYSWTLPLGWSGNSTSNIINVVPGNTSGTIQVTALNACGASSASSLIVTGQSAPTLSVTSTPTFVCIGNSVTIIAYGANSYSWNTGATSTSISVTPSVSASYTVTGYNSVGCISSLIKTINVSSNFAPSIAVAGPELSCQGQAVNLGANGAATYTWQPGNLTGFFVTVSPTISTTYTVTGTASNGCSNWSEYTHLVVECTGLTEYELVQVSVFPNPSNDKLFFSTEVTNAVLFDATGKVVLNIETPCKYIDVSHLSTGLYTLCISDKNGNRIVKKVSRN